MSLDGQTVVEVFSELKSGGGTICVIATDNDRRIEYATTNPKKPINVNK